LDSMADLTGNGGKRHVGRRPSVRRWGVALAVAAMAGVGLSAAGPSAASAEACPNGPFRVGPSALLPDCRAYEMVSPESTQAQRSGIQAISDDGNFVLYNSAGIFADAPGMNKVGGTYAGRRTATGWETTSLNPPAWQFPLYDFAGAADWSTDLRSTLWNVRPVAEKDTNDWTFYVRHEDGTEHGNWLPISPSIPGGRLGSTNGEVVGASATLDSIVVASALAIPLTDGTDNTRVYSAQRKNLYRMSRTPAGDVHVEQLAYQNGATMFPTCTVGLGGASNTARGAYSEDGQTAFLNFGPSCSGTGVGARVWAWRKGQGVIDVSAPRCAPDCSVPGGGPANVLFEGASRDGQRVYFSTSQQLVSADGATGTAVVRRNLYEYDFSRTGDELIPVTADPGTEGAGVRKLVRLSEDGSRAYFVSTGRSLAGPNARNQSPTPGGNNLYVYDRPTGATQGTTTFIGTLSANDSGLWAGDSNQRQAITAPADGRFFVFSSEASLTADKLAGDTQRDVYRYDAQADELRRVWTDDPEHNGEQRVAGASVPFVAGQTAANVSWAASQRISSDGRFVYFDTAEPMAPWDDNGANDAYLWDAQTGETSLISSGKDVEWGAAGVMTPSGDSLTFMSSVPLVPGQTSTTATAYVARVGGGFPLPDPVAPECVGDGCQGPVGDPSPPPLVGSVTFDGSGNAPLPTPARASVGVFAKLKSVSGSVVRLKVRVPGAGRISVRGASVRRSKTSASKAGTYKVRVALRPRAKKRLKNRRKLKVGVRVSYRTKDGRSASKTVRITFKRPKARR
jgi:hypothetical protein